MSQGMESETWRVKLYFLEDESWNDSGTGLASYTVAADGGAHVISVYREESSELLLRYTVSEHAFTQQGERIIMWFDSEKDTNCALSFQDSADCAKMWDIMMRYAPSAENRDIGAEGTCRDKLSGAAESYLVQDGHVDDDYGYCDDLGKEYFPGPCKDNLVEIREKLATSNEIERRAWVNMIVGDSGEYLKKIGGIFHEIRESDNKKNDNDEAVYSLEAQGYHEKQNYENVFEIAGQGLGTIQPTMRTISYSVNEGQTQYERKNPPCGILADVFRLIVLLGDDRIVEMILGTDLFYIMTDCMEYDFALFHSVSFAKIVAQKRGLLKGFIKLDYIGDQEAMAIERLMKLKILRDSLVRPGIEEFGGRVMDVLIMITTNNVCELTFTNPTLLGKLIFSIDVNSETTLADNYSDGDREKYDSGILQRKQFHALRFLRDIFCLSRSLPIERRRELCEHIHLNNLTEPLLNMCSSVLMKSEEVSGTSRPIVAEILCIYSGICPEIIHDTISKGPRPSKLPSKHETPNTKKATSHNQIQQNTSPQDFVDEEEAHLAVIFEGIKQVSKRNGMCFFWVIISRLILDSEVDVLDHLSDTLLNCMNPERYAIGHEKFLGSFYDHYLHWLMLPFMHEKVLIYSSSIVQRRGKQAIASMVKVFVEVLCMCVTGHAYRMKYFVTRNNSLSTVLHALRGATKVVRLLPLQLLRCVILTKDEVYLRHIQKQDLLRPILEDMRDSSSKHDLLTSASLDLVELIQTEDIQILRKYILADFSDCFKHSTLSGALTSLKRGEESIVPPSPQMTAPTLGLTLGRAQFPLTANHTGLTINTSTLGDLIAMRSCGADDLDRMDGVADMPSSPASSASNSSTSPSLSPTSPNQRNSRSPINFPVHHKSTTSSTSSATTASKSEVEPTGTNSDVTRGVSFVTNKRAKLSNTGLLT